METEKDHLLTAAKGPFLSFPLFRYRRGHTCTHTLTQVHTHTHTLTCLRGKEGILVKQFDAHIMNLVLETSLLVTLANVNGKVGTEPDWNLK